MNKKIVLPGIILLIVVVVIMAGVILNAASTDYSYGIDLSGTNATIWFKSNVNTTWVDVHYLINSANQQNFRMTYNSSKSRYEKTIAVANGNVITYFFTYNNGNPAYDTKWYTYNVGGVNSTTVPQTSATVPTTTSVISPSVPASSSVNPPAGYTLKWSDEFNGNSINTSNWTFDIGTGSGGWGNNELEYYTNRPENARIENGNLVIEARKESYNGSAYTSARLKTKGLKSWTYGKIEARIKIPTGQGIWPAFWMLGDNIDAVSWPKCGEIDVMEHVNNATVANGTIHWSDSSGTYAYYGGTTGNIDFNAYHTYSIEWDKSSIIWYLDGNKYWEASILNNVNGTDEFHKPFFILLNLAVGGNWPGSPDSATQFPAKMLVDYVRVFQK